MKWILGSTSLVTIGFFLIAAPNVSAKPVPANYVTLKGGAYFPLSGDLASYDSGFNAEIAVGRYLAPGFAIEAGLGHFEVEGDVSRKDAPDSSRELKVTPLVFSVKGVAPFDVFETFLEVGMGVYFVHDRIDSGEGSGSDDGARLGVHGGLGGSYNLNRRIYLGLEGRYIFVQSHTLDEHTGLEGITVTANVGYRF